LWGLRDQESLKESGISSTLLSVVPISFKLVSGWDQYGRRAPKTFRFGMEFFTYDLDCTKNQIDRSMDIVAVWDEKLCFICESYAIVISFPPSKLIAYTN